MHGHVLQTNQEKMSKSSGAFLRLQILIDRGIDPLAYRYFCLNASYRSKLTFSWDSLEGFANTLDRLRILAHEWGPAGEVNADFVERFNSHVNDDLNTPRALGLTWELVKSDMPYATKKATLLYFDRVFGLGLTDWQPEVRAEEAIPDQIRALTTRRQEARSQKNWQEADALRDQIQAAGYEIEDAPEGYQIRKRQ